MNPLKCHDFTPFTSPSPPKRPSPAPRQQDANQKPQYPRLRCLYAPAPKTAFRHKGVVAGSKGIRGKEKGLLVMDDTTLDNPYAQKIELVTYHMDELV